MALTVTHTTVAADPQTPLLDHTDWNASHSISGTQSASDVDVVTTDLRYLTATDAQATFEEIDNALMMASGYDTHGWRIISEDFIRGSVLADYHLVNNSNGTSAAATITVATTSIGLWGFLNMTTGTTTTGRSSACSTGADFSNGADLDTGDQIFLSVGGVLTDNAPDGTNDFDVITCVLHESNGATWDETTTTSFACYFLGSRSYTNWQFVYVDDSNTLTLVDTGVVYAINTTPLQSMDIMVTWNTTAASNNIVARINKTEVANVTGVRTRSGNDFYCRPGRIEKLAGTTARLLYIDSYVKGYKASNPYD